jgi:hypothetical protein
VLQRQWEALVEYWHCTFAVRAQTVQPQIDSCRRCAGGLRAAMVESTRGRWRASSVLWETRHNTAQRQLAGGAARLASIYIASHILPLSILGIRSPSIPTAEAAFRSILLIIFQLPRRVARGQLDALAK